MNREYFVYAEEDPMKDLYVGWNERERERGGGGRMGERRLSVFSMTFSRRCLDIVISV